MFKRKTKSGGQVEGKPRGPQGQAIKFTIIELIIVVSIIAIVMALLLPALATAREFGKITVCINQLKQIGVASYMYAEDNNQYLPPLADATQPDYYIGHVVDPAVGLHLMVGLGYFGWVPATATRQQINQKFFICPSDTRNHINGIWPYAFTSYWQCWITEKGLVVFTGYAGDKKRQRAKYVGMDQTNKFFSDFGWSTDNPNHANRMNFLAVDGSVASCPRSFVILQTVAMGWNKRVPWMDKNVR